MIRTEYLPNLTAHLSEARRKMGASCPKAFAKLYLAEFLDKPFSSMHHELFSDLAALHTARGSRLAVAAPRGHAKSTVVTLAYLLWALLYEKEAFVVVVSATADQAQRLVDHVKRQLESNPLLVQDFPELAEPRHPTPWRKGVIMMPMPKGALLASYSAGRNLRGIRHQKHRPTLIIADDLEDKAAVIHEERRQKLADWFNATLLKAGTPETNVVVVGTVLHQESLLATLLDPVMSPMWKTRKYAAIVRESSATREWQRWQNIMTSKETCGELTGPSGAEHYLQLYHRRMLNGEVLWPEVYPYQKLMEIRLAEGETAFSAEYQNEPLDPQQCLFARAKISYWDDQYATTEDLLKHFDGNGDFYAGCDPSLANDQTRGDLTAIVILFVSAWSKKKYVVVADIARRAPDDTINQLIEYARQYRGLDIGIEANNFQQTMVSTLRERASKRGLSLYPRAIKNRENKQARIMALESEVNSGKLLFSRKHVTLMRQLREFPMAKYDDGPDALEMAMSRVGRHRALPYSSSTERCSLIVNASPWRITMPWISPHGTHERTQVSMPGRAMQIWLRGPSPLWT